MTKVQTNAQLQEGIQKKRVEQEERAEGDKINNLSFHLRHFLLLYQFRGSLFRDELRIFIAQFLLERKGRK